MRATFEVADVVRKYGEDFIEKYRVHPLQQKVLSAISHCRTAALGGHVERCTDCGEERISYNSCRNRHCPKCQGTRRDKWIEARKADLLACKYFHVVFTLPQVLNTFCLHYPKELYEMLFRASKETILAFGRDERYLGAEMGMISILHTWGQNLSLHPHVHMIVPGGGLSPEKTWKNTRTEGKYLFPVKAMSQLYRRKFMGLFKKFMETCGMEITPELHRELYRHDWVVYAKRPFGSPESVIEYLGRYTQKVAISNHRIKGIENGKVTFSYKDYKTGGQTKELTLEATEFLRRFCMHILPKGFRKIRHYGILSSRNKNKLTNKAEVPVKNQPYTEFFPEKEAVVVCVCCKKGTMERVLDFKPNAPPRLRFRTDKQLFVS